MPIADLVPAYRPVITVRPRPAHVRIEPAAPAHGLRREGRAGADGKASAARALPPYRGRIVDILV